MDFNVNIRVEVTPEFCRALDNIANTITAAFCVTAAANLDTKTLHRAEKIADVVTAPPEEEEHAPAYVPKTPPEPKDPMENLPAEKYFKAMRAELKSVMAKAAKEGKADAVKALLAELGVTKLSQIPKDKLEDALKKAGDL